MKTILLNLILFLSAMSVKANPLNQSLQPSVSDLMSAKTWICERSSTQNSSKTTEKFSFEVSNGQLINQVPGAARIFSQESDGFVSLDFIEKKQTLLLFRMNKSKQLVGEYSVPKVLLKKHKALPVSYVSKEFSVLSYLSCKKSI